MAAKHMRPAGPLESHVPTVRIDCLPHRLDPDCPPGSRQFALRAVSVTAFARGSRSPSRSGACDSSLSRENPAAASFSWLCDREALRSLRPPGGGRRRSPRPQTPPARWPDGSRPAFSLRARPDSPMREAAPPTRRRADTIRAGAPRRRGPRARGLRCRPRGAPRPARSGSWQVRAAWRRGTREALRSRAPGRPA